MSSFDRRALLTGFVALAGCGFRPVYGPGSDALRNGVQVNTPDSREAFRLKGRIEDRLGPPGGNAHQLQVTLGLTEEPVGVSTGQDITRYTLRGSAEFALSTMDGVAISSGSVRTFVSYSATGTSVSTLAAERDARDRLAIALADQIVTRVLAALA